MEGFEQVHTIGDFFRKHKTIWERVFEVFEEFVEKNNPSYTYGKAEKECVTDLIKLLK